MRSYEHEEWPYRKGPIKELKDLGRLPKSSRRGPHWIDHTEIVKVDDVVHYVFHPYTLSNEAFLDIAALVEAGWHVRAYGTTNYLSSNAFQVSLYKE